MPEIRSQPGARLFRTFSSLILILLLASLFLSRNEELSQTAEAVHVSQTVNEINTALAFVVYTLAVNKSLDRLVLLDSQNPFFYLALNQSIPRNYHGEVSSVDDMKANGWYFLKPNGLVIYSSRSSRYVYRLSFDYSDTNQSGAFEAESDKINSLQIVKASKRGL